MVLTDKLSAIGDAIRAKTGKTDLLTLAQMPNEIADIQNGSNIPDGTNVTFGNVDGKPIEREEAYAIASEILNELGAIVQTISGKKVLMTAEDMIYWLNRAQFIPQGNIENMFNTSFDYSISGVIPEVQIGTTDNMFDLSFESSAVGVLQEV